MLSRRKIKAHLCEWLREHAQQAMDRGRSLKDDVDGVSLYIDSVKVEGYSVILSLEERGGGELVATHDYTLILRRVSLPKAEKLAGFGLDVIDDETS